MGATKLVSAVVVVAAGLFLPAVNQAATDEVRVQLLALNDFHGHLEPPAGSDTGGAAYLAGHIAQRERDAEHSWVVGAGDMIGASPFISGGFDDVPAVEALGAAGLDITAVGNHEFDDGVGALRRLRARADFAYLGANVRGARLPAYAIRAAEGIPVAFIGLTLEDTPAVTMPAGVAGLEFTPEVGTVNRLVRRLRRTRDVEAFVVLVHEGGHQSSSDPDACEDLTGPIVPIASGLADAVDVVASAHTHEAYVCEIDGKVVTSAGSYGRLLTDIDLTLNRRSGDVTSAEAENVAITHDVAPQTRTAAIVERHRAAAAPIADRVVGTLGEDLTRAETGQRVADAFRAATGADVAYMNPGGVRASLAGGEVTYGDLYAVLPFGDELEVRTLTGAQLAALGPGLHRSGEAPDPARAYTVATRSFLMAGGDGYTGFTAGRGARSAGDDLAALEASF